MDFGCAFEVKRCTGQIVDFRPFHSTYALRTHQEQQKIQAAPLTANGAFIALLVDILLSVAFAFCVGRLHD
jgi:hypothetical protein